jgi:hypothetical protein
LGKGEVQSGTSKLRSRRADDLPRRFRNAAILDSGRTSRLTGTAEQAEIQVILEALVEFDAPFSGGADQMNPAARRFGLQP